MNKLALTGSWTLRPTGGPVPTTLPPEVPATVPGTIHTDLFAAGLIPDPYLDENERELSWIGESDFAYATRFSVPEGQHDRIDLVAEGLDTIARIRVDGVVIGETRNQHRTHRFDLREALDQHPDGDHELTVDFTSALRWARGAEERIGARPFVGNALPYNAIRKMACNFGWDWGPVLVTAGIWKPISVHAWSTARIDQVVPLVTVGADGVGTVEARVHLEHATDAPVAVRVRIVGPDGASRDEVSVDAPGDDVTGVLIVPDAALWWPRGYGDQPRYRLEVDLLADGEPIDAWSRSVGFRTVEVRNDRDEFGTSFVFVVNGTPVWVKGANWIPDDCFPSRVTAQDYEAGVRDAVDGGFNLLRIWGGGLYEDDALYEACSREGLMVWQDFLFACAAYSEADELRDEVEAEAREHVGRLAAHASLVFWNGSNENVEGYYEWGWRDALGEGVDWGRGYYDELLPRIVREVDPTRSYLPSSPFSPNDYEHPREPSDGSVHSWEVWNREDYSAYRNDIPRFVAEFGYQGPPNWATLTRAVHDEPLRADAPGFLAHQKAEDGNGKLERGMAPHVAASTSFDDWHFATQLTQARAITFGVEHFRSYWPRTTGSVIWQLNDCWPVTSWAIVDGDRRRKPVWYALRAVNAPRLLTFQPRPEGLALVAHNDTATRWAESVTVVRTTLDGTEQGRAVVTVDLDARGSFTMILPSYVATVQDASSEVLVATAGSARRAVWYASEDRHLALPPLTIAASATATRDGVVVDVRADAFTKDLVLAADRVAADAVVDDQLVTLFPGETHRFTVRTSGAPDPTAFLRHPVLQAANVLAHPDDISVAVTDLEGISA
ncbi:beta-mannosidase [Curtobacterium sp. PhB130]|uniref:glycoside hydrolase family 2 protein n=1 Tax=unclassified Curtobacterium TaxID=257496 RepID=UPI000FB655F0|nr:MULTISPECIES: glycoside hydrolase family 2 protein [unclassified Curtobacterium]ROS71850.1 beta-mannosidase [Curtobacterium sp. PhB130]TCK58244.1 beta-mannosidase [Curtobacterium sp. PhB136]